MMSAVSLNEAIAQAASSRLTQAQSQLEQLPDLLFKDKLSIN